MKILVVNPYGIGDALCTIPLLKALREAFPKGTLGLVCNRRVESVARMFPGVSRVLVFEKDDLRQAWAISKLRWLRAMRDLRRTLQADRWDAVIDLSLNWQIGATLAFAGIRTRYGFDYRGRGKFLTRTVPLSGFSERHVSRYYLDVLSLLNIPTPRQVEIRLQLPPDVLREAEQWLIARGADPTRRWIALVPGGGASWGPQAAAKQWPARHFAALANQFALDPHSQILLLGDATDAAVCQAVATACARPATLLPPMPSTLDLAAALAHCDAVIGNDSGALHLAVAVGTPSVTIFGPANPMVYGPLSLTPDGRHRIAVKPLACRPCYAQFKLPPCPWDHRCLETLEPNDVYALARPLLAA